MKKTVFGLLLIFLFSCGDSDWQTTQDTGTIEAYQTYIAENPDAENIEKAKLILDSLLQIKDTTEWSVAVKQDLQQKYEEYIANNPNGQFVEKAQLRIKILINDKEEIDFWEKTKQENTVDAYKKYIETYPEGMFLYEALKSSFYIEEPDFVQKYERIIEFFQEIDIAENGSNLIAKYLADDSFTFNGKKYLPPYSDKKFSKDESFDIYGNTQELEMYMYGFVPFNQNGLEFEIKENNNITTLEFVPSELYMNYYRFIWEYRNEQFVLVEMQIEFQGDV